MVFSVHETGATGDYRGAIRSTQAAMIFFTNSRRNTGRKAIEFILLGYLELAGLYERFGTTTENSRAALYRKGIAAYPDVSKGLPYLKLGRPAAGQGAYQESLESYNKV